MKARLPNLITSVRFLLALVFFVLMDLYHYREDRGNVALLDWAFWMFVVTAVTDILDGYLARRWNQESTFGRILDPLVDKVLVIGAFVYLASDHFSAQAADGRFYNVTGVAAWMVILILIRELLVTGLRGFSEAKGLSFKATIPGKIKMFVQCVAAGGALAITAHCDTLFSHPAWMWVRTILLWAMVVVTTISMLVYIERARHLFSLAMQKDGDHKPQG